jgi:hypothetical protein
VSIDVCLSRHKTVQVNSLVIALWAFPIDFETTARPAFGRRATCESRLSVDIREFHRQGFLRPAGQQFSYSWTYNGKPLGSIDVRTEADAVVLTVEGIVGRFNSLQSGSLKPEPMSLSSKSKSAEQRVPLVWTPCHLGGLRPWFSCSASVGDRPCGRRVAKLYLRDAAIFACRRCYGLVYASQYEIPRHRAISRAQKIRMRLGGSANLAEPLPQKPRGMHRWTYYRLLARAVVAEERSAALMADYLQRRNPRASAAIEQRRVSRHHNATTRRSPRFSPDPKRHMARKM